MLAGDPPDSDETTTASGDTPALPRPTAIIPRPRPIGQPETLAGDVAKAFDRAEKSAQAQRPRPIQAIPDSEDGVLLLEGWSSSEWLTIDEESVCSLGGGEYQ